MRFDLVTVNLVLAIADSRSITAGAERSHLALAVAGRRLSDTEARLGVKLFDRHAHGVELTEAGHALARHVRSLNQFSRRPYNVSWTRCAHWHPRRRQR